VILTSLVPLFFSEVSEFWTFLFVCLPWWFSWLGYRNCRGVL